MPKSIKYFEICLLVSLTIKLIFSAIPSIGHRGFYGEDGFIITFILIFLSVFLIFFISKKGNFIFYSFIAKKEIDIAKKVLIILFFVNVFIGFTLLSEMNGNYGFADEILIARMFLSIEFILQGIGIYFLFTEESRAWFEKSDKAE